MVFVLSGAELCCAEITAYLLPKEFYWRALEASSTLTHPRPRPICGAVPITPPLASLARCVARVTVTGSVKLDWPLVRIYGLAIGRAYCGRRSAVLVPSRPVSIWNPPLLSGPWMSLPVALFAQTIAHEPLQLARKKKAPTARIAPARWGGIERARFDMNLRFSDDFFLHLLRNR